MSDPIDTQIYAGLLKIRGEEAARLDSMPYTVLSDSNIRDIIQIKPKDISELAAIRNISVASVKKLGDAILKCIEDSKQAFASSSHSRHSTANKADSNTQQRSRSLEKVFIPRKATVGGKIVTDDTTPKTAINFDLALSSTFDQESLNETEFDYYIKFQKQKLSPSQVDPSREIGHIQSVLLDVFAKGYPVQLSRLEVIIDRSISNAIPIVLSLRSSTKVSDLPDTGRLSQLDLQDKHFSTKIQQLYPHVSQISIKASLCEWYHDLNPEFQLNSAKFVEPTLMKAKRKEPTPDEEESIQPTSNNIILANSTQKESKEPKHQDIQADPTNLSLSVMTDSQIHIEDDPPLSSLAESPLPASSLVSKTRSVSKAAFTPGSNWLTSGRKSSPRNQRARTLFADDSEDEKDDPTDLDYSENRKNDKKRKDVSAQTESELFKFGPRPKKQPKRSSMDTIGMIPFMANTNAERNRLADDDWSGTSDAYFDAVYSPAAKINKHQKIPHSNDVLSPAVPQSLSFSNPEPKPDIIPTENMTKLTEASTENISKDVSNAEVSVSVRQLTGLQLTKMTPLQIFEKFQVSRSSAYSTVK